MSIRAADNEEPADIEPVLVVKDGISKVESVVVGGTDSEAVPVVT